GRRVQGGGERRVLRLVVGGQRAVLQAGGRVEPALAVGLHDERVVAAQRIGADRVRVGYVVRCAVGYEVRDVVPGPPPLLRIPPDVLLASAPGCAVGGGGGAVVEDAAVGGPGPRPLGGHP